MEGNFPNVNVGEQFIPSARRENAVNRMLNQMDGIRKSPYRYSSRKNDETIFIAALNLTQWVLREGAPVVLTLNETTGVYVANSFSTYTPWCLWGVAQERINIGSSGKILVYGTSYLSASIGTYDYYDFLVSIVPDTSTSSIYGFDVGYCIVSQFKENYPGYELLDMGFPVVKAFGKTEDLHIFVDGINKNHFEYVKQYKGRQFEVGYDFESKKLFVNEGQIIHPYAYNQLGLSLGTDALKSVCIIGSKYHLCLGQDKLFNPFPKITKLNAYFFSSGTPYLVYENGSYDIDVVSSSSTDYRDKIKIASLNTMPGETSFRVYAVKQEFYGPLTLNPIVMFSDRGISVD